MIGFLVGLPAIHAVSASVRNAAVSGKMIPGRVLYGENGEGDDHASKTRKYFVEDDENAPRQGCWGVFVRGEGRVELYYSLLEFSKATKTPPLPPAVL